MYSKDAILAATKSEAVKMIQENIDKSDKWLFRAVLAIFKFQTRDEQMGGITKHNNGVGFNGLDARFFTLIASELERMPDGSSLRTYEITSARRRIKKYAGQLLALIG